MEKDNKPGMVYKLLLLLRMITGFSLWFQDAIPQHVTVRHNWNNLWSQTNVSNSRFLLVSLSNITHTHRCCKADMASTFPLVQISRIQCAGCSITGTKFLPVQHFHKFHFVARIFSAIQKCTELTPNLKGSWWYLACCAHVAADADVSFACFWLNH